MPGIIWLASYPKSGNTWTRAFLANYLDNRNKPVPINELPNFIFGDNLAAHYAQLAGVAEEAVDDALVAAWRDRVHHWLANAKPHDVFVKTHSLVGVANGKPLITPQATAGAIYIIRNPFDAAVSFANHYQVTVSRAVEIMTTPDQILPKNAGQTSQFIGDWGQHVKSWTKAQGLTMNIMRYEDMVSAPQNTFGGLIKFLGMKTDKQRLRRAIKFSSFKELKKQEEKEKFVESRPDGKTKFFRSGGVGGWRDEFRDEDIQRMIDTHHGLLTEFKYLDEKGDLTI